MALSGTIVGYWKNDETGTGTRADATANGLTLTNNNSCTNATGILNNATNFVRASSQYLSRATEANLEINNSSFFLNFWVKFGTLTDYNVIVSKSGNAEYWIYAQANGAIAAEIGSGSASVSKAAGTVTTGVWYNIALWWDKPNNLLKLAINDGAVASGSANVTVNSSSGAFSIGAGSAPNNYCDADIDEVLWAKFVPTAQDITDCYGSGTPPGYATLSGSGGGSFNGKPCAIIGAA